MACRTTIEGQSNVRSHVPANFCFEHDLPEQVKRLKHNLIQSNKCNITTEAKMIPILKSNKRTDSFTHFHIFLHDKKRKNHSKTKLMRIDRLDFHLFAKS